ncbi:nucleotidyltransferase family protein [Prevotella sp. P2-180]|uniref:nucleotidyltransferase family protein n=1 Tax=Prevotella sp. P2-180 TaxID=2024224 RepID=UPI000B963A07|nr:nucleotidyltransferase family protein [Prevotella sp. P2-180]OYP62570.1 hypothetical protein CIK98_13380 [Prevotella sp. P2-180]
MSNILFDFIQIAIGNRKSLSATINDSDWLRLFEFCKSQYIVGIVYTAVEKLHNQGIICPSSLEEQWRAFVYKIEKQNEVINRKCAEISRQYNHDGFFTCILNSQGSLLNYPEKLRMRRMPGDIEVLASPLCDISVAVLTGSNDVEYATYNGFRAVREYVKMQHRIDGYFAIPIVRYNHIEAPKIDGTEVEVYFRAAHLYSPLRNWRLQKWMNDHADECMKNKTHLGFAMPTSSVNVIHQMTHMYNHHIDGGLGFRQLMDYYYALRVWHNDVMECKDLQSQGMWSEGLGTHVMSNEEVMSVIRSFGMTKFTAAVMYVLHKVFENEEYILNEECRMKNEECSEADIPWMICEPNEKEGKKLLAEIMNSGNFGHYDSEKPNVYQHRFQYHIWKFKRIFRLAMSYPEEALWEPVFRGWRKVQRIKD